MTDWNLTFIAAAAFAIFVTGLSKSGFLTGIGVLGVPILTLAIPPVEAAAIMLPILIAQDVVSVFFYRNAFDKKNLVILLPAATVGIGIGWLAAAHTSETAVRLLVGLIGVAFALDYFFKFRPQTKAEAGLMTGSFWGAISGFTSFVSHAGGAPFQIYVMPQQLSPSLFAGTSVMFFAVVNAIKLVPYYALGQLKLANLTTSLMLLPIAPLGVLIGIWLVKKLPPGPFYRIAYGLLLLVSLKLVYDGFGVFRA